MVTRRVFALLLIKTLLAVPLCVLGCTPTQLRETADHAPAQKSSCHEASRSGMRDNDIPDSPEEPDAPCRQCVHLFNAVKRSDSVLLFSLAVSDYSELSHTSLAAQQTLEFEQHCDLASSPPGLTSVLRI